MPDELQRFVDEAPDKVLLAVARALDRRADELGRNHAGRMARALATDAHKLWLAVCDADEIRSLSSEL